jgi:hypothetical protein
MTLGLQPKSLGYYTGLVPSDPWVVSQVVGILWVVSHHPLWLYPLWTRLVVVSLHDDDTHYVVVAPRRDEKVHIGCSHV